MTIEDRFEEFKAEFPRRAGNHCWPKARQLAMGVVYRGEATWDELIAGAKRYKRFLEFTGKIKTEYVMMPTTWLGANTQGWGEDYELPTVDPKQVKFMNPDQQREVTLIKQGNEEGLTRAPSESLDSFSDRIRKAYLARITNKAPAAEQVSNPAGLSSIRDTINHLRVAK
jgi:hypothetical protein